MKAAFFAAQSFTLPYRRLAVGGAFAMPRASDTSRAVQIEDLPSRKANVAPLPMSLKVGLRCSAACEQQSRRRSNAALPGSGSWVQCAKTMFPRSLSPSDGERVRERCNLQLFAAPKECLK